LKSRGTSINSVQKVATTSPSATVGKITEIDLANQVGQLRHVHRNPAPLVAGEGFGRCARIIEIDIRRLLSAVIAHESCLSTDYGGESHSHHTTRKAQNVMAIT
jgi:hypothetical protein